MSSGFCGIPGMSQPRLDRCEGCAHNKGLFAPDCRLYCYRVDCELNFYGVEKTDGAGIVLECDDFEPSPGGDAQ